MPIKFLVLGGGILGLGGRAEVPIFSLMGVGILCVLVGCPTVAASNTWHSLVCAVSMHSFKARHIMISAPFSPKQHVWHTV